MGYAHQSRSQHRLWQENSTPLAPFMATNLLDQLTLSYRYLWKEVVVCPTSLAEVRYSPLIDVSSIAIVFSLDGAKIQKNIGKAKSFQKIIFQSLYMIMLSRFIFSVIWILFTLF